MTAFRMVLMQARNVGAITHVFTGSIVAHRQHAPFDVESTTSQKDNTMNINLSVCPLIALIAGILILVVPRLLNFIVALYLIIIGLLGLFGTGAVRL